MKSHLSTAQVAKTHNFALLLPTPEEREILCMAEQLDETALNVYTDGSCYEGPRRGGLGYLFVTVGPDGHPVLLEECPQGWKSATNNQMELEACIEALDFATDRYSPFDLSEFSKIVIRTDSRYVVDGYEKAKWRWPTTNWRTKNGTGPPVANTGLWKLLLKLVKRSPLRVEIRWVKGHKGDPHNLRVDELAKASANTPSKRTLKVQRVRRKKSPRKVERGSVRMEGQVTTIHITVDEWLPSPHRCYSYTYEVMDEDSPFHLHRDLITSHVLLKAGHTYRVRFNDDPDNPRIEEMLEEIPREPAADDV